MKKYFAINPFSYTFMVKTNCSWWIIGLFGFTQVLAFSKLAWPQATVIFANFNERQRPH